jgi:leader peptidase (prepilin peptidase) / N-methyltransferase
MAPYAPFETVVASSVLGGAMAIVAAEDLRRFRIPDLVLGVAALAGLSSVWASAWRVGLDPVTTLAVHAVSGLVWAAVLFGLREVFYRLKGHDGLGLGDVKLAGVGALWLGWNGFAVALTVAAIAALAFVALRVLTRGRWRRVNRVPLGTFLAPVIWGVWFGQQLILPV